LVYEILWKLEEVQRHKKAKGYYEELLVLEELQIKAVLRLMKAKLLIETVVKGDTISKEKLSTNIGNTIRWFFFGSKSTNVLTRSLKILK
jgi:hypothetical protein